MLTKLNLAIALIILTAAGNSTFAAADTNRIFSAGKATLESGPTGTNSNISSVLQNRWELFWRDEFSGTKLNESNWSRCARGNADWKNTMSDDPRLLFVKDGVLHLRGIVNDGDDKDTVPYLTAGVNSRGKFSFKYGKVLIRARFKSAQGAWPALWMLGSEKRWPANGEIDLMEHLNFDNKIYQTVHSEYTEKIDINPADGQYYIKIFTAT